MVRIFVEEKGENGLWSIHLTGKQQNEFRAFFNKLNDPDYLHNFFEAHKYDLWAGFFGNLTIEEAVVKTQEEVEEMENALLDYAEQGFSGNANCLQHFFKPLNNHEYVICTHQKSKARLKRGWLRMYAIRLAPNCYLVTGGAIKITYNMERIHLQEELIKLERAKLFLRNNCIEFPEDLNIIQHE